jgi:hypothetical protein
MHERALAAARDALGSERFAARFRDGRRLPAEDAIAHQRRVPTETVAGSAR